MTEHEKKVREFVEKKYAFLQAEFDRVGPEEFFRRRLETRQMMLPDFEDAVTQAVDNNDFEQAASIRQVVRLLKGEIDILGRFLNGEVDVDGVNEYYNENMEELLAVHREITMGEQKIPPDFLD